MNPVEVLALTQRDLLIVFPVVVTTNFNKYSTESPFHLYEATITSEKLRTANRVSYDSIVIFWFYIWDMNLQAWPAGETYSVGYRQAQMSLPPYFLSTWRVVLPWRSCLSARAIAVRRIDSWLCLELWHVWNSSEFGAAGRPRSPSYSSWCCQKLVDITQCTICTNSVINMMCVSSKLLAPSRRHTFTFLFLQ